MSAGTLTPERLSAARWCWGPLDADPFTTALVFAADGAIEGYTHENEAGWRLIDGVPHIYHRDGHLNWRLDPLPPDGDLLAFRATFQAPNSWTPEFLLAEFSPTRRRLGASVRHPPDHPDGIRRVQVGCGPHHLRPHWWNTDLRRFGGIDEALDATAPWRYRGILDFVYGEHFLEHLEVDQAIDFLVEAGRALRVGGRVRLSTPALEWVMRSHYTFQPSGSTRDFDETMNINRAFHGWGHKFLYSRTVLERLLVDVGYEDVRFFDFGHSDTPELDRLELNGQPNQPNDTQWIIEGRRGEREPSRPELLYAEFWDKLLAHVRPGH